MHRFVRNIAPKIVGAYYVAECLRSFTPILALVALLVAVFRFGYKLSKRYSVSIVEESK